MRSSHVHTAGLVFCVLVSVPGPSLAVSVSLSVCLSVPLSLSVRASVADNKLLCQCTSTDAAESRDFPAQMRVRHGSPTHGLMTTTDQRVCGHDPASEPLWGGRGVRWLAGAGGALRRSLECVDRCGR